MVALGLTHMLAYRLSERADTQADSTLPLHLSIIGLLGVFAVGYPGYFVFDAIWPGYYYSPVAAGKNTWLLGQAFFIAIYFVGFLAIFAVTRRVLNGIQQKQLEI